MIWVDKNQPIDKVIKLMPYTIYVILTNQAFTQRKGIHVWFIAAIAKYPPASPCVLPHSQFLRKDSPKKWSKLDYCWFGWFSVHPLIR